MTDRSTLQAQAVQIRDETLLRKNTASRVGTMLKNLADSASLTFDVMSYGADSTGATDSSAAFAAAAAAALAAGAEMTIPSGTFVVTSFTHLDGLRVSGQGDSTILQRSFWTATGTSGSEIQLTDPAAKGARTISIPGTGLDGSWLRVSSCINSQSSDAVRDQLGTHNSDQSFLGEFVRVNVGSAGSVSLYGALVFPYSNTPGGDSGSFTTSVARVMSFHTSGRLRRVKFVDCAAGQTEIFRARFCNDFVLEDVTFDANDSSVQPVRLEYCLNSRLVRVRAYGKRTSVTGAQENCFVISSSQGCFGESCSAQNGYQGFDITYQVQDATYRGGPSINCGYVNLQARDCSLDGATSHYGTFGSYFINPIVSGSPRGIRIRGRRDRVLGGSMVCGDGTEIGVLIDSAAAIDARVSQVHVQGYLRGIMYDHSESGLATLEALLGCGSCEISHNTIQDCAAQGIFLNTAYTAASLMGPRVVHNEIHDCATDLIRVNSYNNGTVIDQNRMSGVASGMRAIRYEANIKRLYIGHQHIYNVSPAGFAIGGPSVSTFMTDSATFPGGETEARLRIEEPLTDAITPFTGTIRSPLAFPQPKPLGWQPFVHGLATGAPSGIERSSFGAYLGPSGAFLEMQTLDTTGNIQRTHTLSMRGPGDPEGVWPAPVGYTFLRTNGASGTTLYVKESGTGATGWRGV